MEDGGEVCEGIGAKEEDGANVDGSSLPWSGLAKTNIKENIKDEA